MSSATASALRGILGNMGDLTHEQWESLAAIFSPHIAPRHTVMTTQGEIERFIYLVMEGLQRVCHYHADGRESTIVFTYAPSMGGVIDSFLLQAPSRFTYETLTPSKFLRASFSNLDRLMNESPAILRLMHNGTAQAMSGTLERVVELQTLTSEEKFRRLLERSPHILGLVPHRYLASYIGIDPTNFSKLLNSVRV